MYTNPLDALRELVQNSLDSVAVAEGGGTLKPGGGRVDLFLDEGKRGLRLRDNGMGVPGAEAAERLLNIGMSSKRIEDSAGFRGIGRLAAIAYCRKLTFRTSSPGERRVAEVALDCDQLRKESSPTLRHLSELSAVVARHSEVRETPGRTAEHFFEVELEGITAAADVFLKPHELDRYLGAVAPVPFDAQRFHHAATIENFAREHNFRLPTLEVVIHADGFERLVFKPYRNTYETHKTNGGGHKVRIKDVAFFPEKPDPSNGFWTWYGLSELVGVLDDPMAGIRLRKNNISLGGGASVARLFAEQAESNRRFNSYFIGELHVTCPDTIPNARRDGLEDSDAWQRIRRQLRTLVQQHCAEIRAQSSGRNASPEVLAARTDRVKEDVTRRAEKGFASPAERDACISKVEAQAKKLETALGRREQKGDVSAIKAAKAELDKVAKKLTAAPLGVKDLSPSLTGKEQKLINDVLGLLHEALEPGSYEKARRAILAHYQLPPRRH